MSAVATTMVTIPATNGMTPEFRIQRFMAMTSSDVDDLFIVARWPALCYHVFVPMRMAYWRIATTRVQYRISASAQKSS
jgi:hypothetical protein